MRLAFPPEVMAQHARARNIFTQLKIAGLVQKPDCCEQCGRKRRSRRSIQAHHDDYDKPLRVRWLCSPCHQVADREVATRLAHLRVRRTWRLKFHQVKLTLVARKALREISATTGVKMWFAMEQAIFEKLAAVKASKARASQDEAKAS